MSMMLKLGLMPTMQLQGAFSGYSFVGLMGCFISVSKGLCKTYRTQIPMDMVNTSGSTKK
jgi:hypothetical protein